ncbi:MAG: hypothetical protein Q4E13_00495 [Clostridia bacterium]|nr:hypothetical protein [Clostridia bacterium]
MALFEKRELIFRKRDKAGFRQVKSVLKEAGITGIQARSYENEPPVCGCGSKLDPRDFGDNGKVERSFYAIFVPVSQAGRARQLLEPLGLNCIEESRSRHSWI